MRTRRSPPSLISEMRPICSSSRAGWRARLEQHLGVDRVDDLHVARQQPLEQRHRPAFQRLRQQRVVGVGEGPLGDVPGRVEVDRRARPSDRRISSGTATAGWVSLRWIAALSGSDVQVAILLEMALHDVLQRSGREEILLAQPQFLPGHVRIGGVKHARQRVGLVALGKRTDVVAGIEGVEQDRIDRHGRPQPQRIHAVAAPADHRRVVGDSQHVLRAASRHGARGGRPWW